MAKLGKISDENQKLVDETIAKTGLNNYMNIRCLSIAKQKPVIKVSRANATTEYVGKLSDTVFLYIKENVFDMLETPQKIMVVQDALSQVSYDLEKDKILITKPEICVSLESYRIYGESIIKTMEAAYMAQQAIDEEEREKKAAERENKKKK